MPIPHPDVPLINGRYAPEMFTVGSRWDEDGRRNHTRTVRNRHNGRVIFNYGSMAVNPNEDIIEEINPSLLIILYRGANRFVYRRIDGQKKLF